MRDHPEQHNAGSPPRRADPDVVALCRALLQRAESGELSSLAIAGQTSDGCVATAYTLGRDGSIFTLAGVLAEVQRRVLDHGADAEEE